MFPFLATLTGGAANHITTCLKDLRSAVTGLPDDVCGTSLRVGAANLIVNHPSCELIHAIVRGGWDYSGLCNIFEYIQACNHLLNIAARALSGWNNPRLPTYPPRLDCIRNVENSITIDNMISHLFTACPRGAGLQKSGK